jgi:hypothetical protein
MLPKTGARTSYGTQAAPKPSTASQGGPSIGRASKSSYNRGDYVTENGAKVGAEKNTLLKDTFNTADKEL